MIVSLVVALFRSTAVPGRAITIRTWILAFAAALPFLSSPGNAADGPGLGKLQYGPTELFQPVSVIVSDKGQGRAALVNGYLMVIDAADIASDSGAPGIEFWDVSDPRNPRRQRRYENSNTRSLREAHGFTLARYGNRDLLLLQAIRGIQIWDVTNPDDIAFLSYLQLPGIRPSDYGGAWWTFWQAPYVFVAGVDEGLYVVDASDPSEPELVTRMPSSEIAGLNPGIVQAVGNLLFVGRHHDTGYALMDISDPATPKLRASIAGSSGYSHMFAAGRILTSGGNGGSRTMQVYDVSPTGQISFARSGTRICNDSSQQTLSNGGYGSYQDGYFFSGFSNRIVKFDIATGALVGCGTSAIANRDEDFADVLGNLVWGGNDHGQGSALIVHQLAPDTHGPDVHWVHPPDGATGVALTGRIGVSMSDNIDLDSVTSSTFTVREVGGQKLSGLYSVQLGLVNFSPDRPLRSDRTYEVLVDGIKDISGNAGMPFRSVFSTERIETADCKLSRMAPAEVGATVSFGTDSLAGTPPVSYTWNFGDGTTPVVGGTTQIHTYESAGRFNVVLTVTDLHGSAACSGVQIVHNPISAVPPAASTTIVQDGSRSYNVNPDNGTVTAISLSSLTKAWEATAGSHPKTVTLGPDGSLWVTADEQAMIYVLDRASGTTIETIELPRGSAPFGVVFAPDGQSAYVSLQATGRLLEISRDGQILADVDAGPSPRGIAITPDSARIYVTRFISAATTFGNPSDPSTIVLPRGELREFSTGPLRQVAVHRLQFDTGPDTENSGRGVPNYLNAVTISRDGRTALIPSKKDNVARGQFLDGRPFTFESRVRGIVSEFDLAGKTERASRRIDFDDRSLPQSLVFSPLGDLFFVGFVGSNLVDVYDSQSHDVLASISVGRAPDGMVIDEEGRQLLVHNLMSRTVSVLDISDLLDGTAHAVVQSAEIDTVDHEALPPTMLRGKQVFYDASDPRMNQDGYLTCASCHLDGDDDGQIWDVTQIGEGLRNTISLVGRAGTGHGNLHWTANFDEIQDFELDIRELFGGSGFLSDTDFAATQDSLGAPKAGLNSDLDALAAYVSLFDRFPESPYRNPDGGLTESAEAGRCVFDNKGCADCHAGENFTDGLRHDVGTIQANSGLGQGVPLAGVGFDTPTLQGTWSTPPYLHNGQAQTMMDVLAGTSHVGSLTSTERSNLRDYLLQIDGHIDPVQECPEPPPEPPPVVPPPVTPVTSNGGGSVGIPALLMLFALAVATRRRFAKPADSFRRKSVRH